MRREEKENVFEYLGREVVLSHESSGASNRFCEGSFAHWTFARHLTDREGEQEKRVRERRRKRKSEREEEKEKE